MVTLFKKLEAAGKKALDQLGMFFVILTAIISTTGLIGGIVCMVALEVFNYKIGPLIAYIY